MCAWVSLKTFFQTIVPKEKENVFDALEWLATMCSHVPNKGEQMVKYYGYYRNVSWGNRKNKIRMNRFPRFWSRL